MNTQNLPSLATLEERIALLLDEREALKTKIEDLEYACEKQRTEMVRTHAELVELQNKHRLLQTAYALTGNSEQRDKAKKQITKLIDNVDGCLCFF